MRYDEVGRVRVGERPVVAGAAAIAGALSDATGVGFTALPSTGDTIATGRAQATRPEGRRAA